MISTLLKPLKLKGLIVSARGVAGMLGANLDGGGNHFALM
jgi:hypothetical protein